MDCLELFKTAPAVTFSIILNVKLSEESLTWIGIQKNHISAESNTESSGHDVSISPTLTGTLLSGFELSRTFPLFGWLGPFSSRSLTLPPSQSAQLTALRPPAGWVSCSLAC